MFDFLGNPLLASVWGMNVHVPGEGSLLAFWLVIAGTALAALTMAMGKASVMGALSLYLNFINMFQMLLQLFGQRRDE